MLDVKTGVESFKGDEAVSRVDTVGYVPSEDRIRSLLDAGNTLVSFREAMKGTLYDLRRRGQDIGSVNWDAVALRKPSNDLADLSEFQRLLAKRTADITSRVAQHKAAVAKQQASNVSSVPASAGVTSPEVRVGETTASPSR